MQNLAILLKQDEEFFYFKVNRCLLEDRTFEIFEEGEEVALEVPIITMFILDELAFCECLKEIAINENSIIIRKEDVELSIDLINKVIKVIRRCFNIERLLSQF